MASGSNWKILFSELGVKDSRIVTIHYWLPKSFPVSLKPKMLSANEFPKFIFVGWMIKEKGVREILAALDSLIDEYSFTFTFVGAGPMLDYVIESIRNSKWESRVFAKGWLSNQQKEMELSTSHVFILPSYAEGFPMSLIEALSFGLPAICSDVGGISDSLHDGENGFLIPPKNIPALKEAMEFYIKNPNILIKHSLKSLEVVRGNHEVEMNCKKLFDTLLMSRD